MPIGIPAALGIGGILASAFGKSGNQGSVQQNSRSTQDVNLTNTTSQTELPEIAAFRNLLLPQFQQEFARAQRPVFGKEQQASFLDNLNTLTKSATDRLGASLAGRGASDSGAASAGFSDIERQRTGEAVNFFRDLPFQEEQARSARVAPLLNLGLSFAGRGPVNTTSTQTGQTSTTGESTGSQKGPGFLKSLAGEAGGLIGAGLGNPAVGQALGFPNLFGDAKGNAQSIGTPFTNQNILNDRSVFQSPFASPTLNNFRIF